MVVSQHRSTQRDTQARQFVRNWFEALLLALLAIFLAAPSAVSASPIANLGGGLATDGSESEEDKESNGNGNGNGNGGKEDAGLLHLRGSAFPVEEEAGVVQISVRRQRGSDGAISVSYETTSGSASEDDYVPTSGVLEWEDGDRSTKSFFVEILDDDLAESQETFGVRIFEPTGDAALGNPTTASVRIKPSDQEDDDSGDDGEGDDEDEAGKLKLTRENYAVYEGDGMATFTVERDDGNSGAATVEYMTLDGSATDGSDYSGVTGLLEWADGEDGEKMVEVAIFDDTEPEDLETITVVLTNATGAQLGRRDTASIQIIDDDGAEGTCVPDGETLCLGDGRFQITGEWTDFDGNTGAFQVVPGTDDTGLVWFFDDDNYELLIKVLDGCPVNQHYWVFYAATTNVGFSMEVLDLVSGQTRTYANGIGRVASTTTDTTAFATCSD